MAFSAAVFVMQRLVKKFMVLKNTDVKPAQI